MQTVQLLRKVCAEIATHMNAATDREAALQTAGSKLETLYFDQKPTQAWYLLEVAYSLLMPAHASMMEDIWEFQVSRDVIESIVPKLFNFSCQCWAHCILILCNMNLLRTITSPCAPILRCCRLVNLISWSWNYCHLFWEFRDDSYKHFLTILVTNNVWSYKPPKITQAAKNNPCFLSLGPYTLWTIKTCHLIFIHNFDKHYKHWLIFKIISLLESAVNLPQGLHHISHFTCNTPLHYLVKNLISKFWPTWLSLFYNTNQINLIVCVLLSHLRYYLEVCMGAKYGQELGQV